MDAEELLRGDAPFVADTSAWWRAATLPNELGSLLQRAVLADRFWITPIVRMEVLYSARTSPEYAELEQELDALRILRNEPRHRRCRYERDPRARRARRRLPPRTAY